MARAIIKNAVKFKVAYKKHRRGGDSRAYNRRLSAPEKENGIRPGAIKFAR